MKKSDALRLKTRKMIAKNLIVLVTLAVVAIVGAFSWFSQTTTASAGSLTAKTKISDALEFYIMPAKDNQNGGQVDQYNDINTKLSNNAIYNQQHPNEPQKNTSWHIGEITLDTDNAEFKFLEDLFLSESTSDGKTFKIPELIQYGDIACVDTGVAFEDAIPNENYMSFDLYFRCKTQNCNVLLTEESIIEPSDDSSLDGTTYDTTNSENENDIKPAAIGAVRLSILNASNERQLLWIPGPCVWYDGINDRLYTGLSGNGFSGKGSVTTVNGTTFTQTTEGTNNHAYYAESGQTKTRTVINSDDANAEGAVLASEDGDYTLPDNVTVVTLNQTSGDYYYGHVRVNLWIEGEDSEARLKMVGGKFMMSLCFDIANPN